MAHAPETVRTVSAPPGGGSFSLMGLPFCLSAGAEHSARGGCFLSGYRRSRNLRRGTPPAQRLEGAAVFFKKEKKEQKRSALSRAARRENCDPFQAVDRYIKRDVV